MGRALKYESAIETSSADMSGDDYPAASSAPPRKVKEGDEAELLGTRSRLPTPPFRFPRQLVQALGARPRRCIKTRGSLRRAPFFHIRARYNPCAASASSLVPAPGRRPAYGEAAAALGRLLAEQGIGVVYGGAMIGLMGRVADAACAAGGEVIGVIPQSLVEFEVAHMGLDDLRIVGSMHERKALMAELSDAFIALPGGIGTLRRSSSRSGPGHSSAATRSRALCSISRGTTTSFSGFLDHVVEEAFLRSVHRGMILVETEPVRLLEALRSYSPPGRREMDRPARSDRGYNAGKAQRGARYALLLSLRPVGSKAETSKPFSG